MGNKGADPLQLSNLLPREGFQVTMQRRIESGVKWSPAEDMELGVLETV